MHLKAYKRQHFKEPKAHKIQNCLDGKELEDIRSYTLSDAHTLSELPGKVRRNHAGRLCRRTEPLETAGRHGCLVQVEEFSCSSRFDGPALDPPELKFSREVSFAVDLHLTMPLGHLYLTPAIGSWMSRCSLHFEICAEAETDPALQPDMPSTCLPF